MRRPRGPLTHDPSDLAAPLVPRPDSPYYLALAAPRDYATLERLNAEASREEVALPLTAATARWLVDDNPAGRGFVVVARSRADDEIVGHFIFYPKRVVVRPVPGAAPVSLTAYLYVILYVLPAFRRVGVFSAMFRYGMDLLARAEVPFAYTVPNPRSAEGFLKMGQRLLGHAPFWARPSGLLGIPLRLLSAPRTGLAARSLRVEMASGFSDAHASVAAEAPSDAQVWGGRSLDELRWRFERRPDVEYDVWDVRDRGQRLVAYAVTRRMQIRAYDALVLCDLWTGPGSGGSVAAVVDRIGRASSDRPDLIIAIGGHSGPLGRVALSTAGLLPVPQRLLPQPVAVIGGPVGHAASGADPAGVPLRRWQLTPYDWDVF